MSRRVAIVWLVGLALLAALLLLAVQRRSLAEASIVSRLRSLGVEEPRLRVSRLDVDGAELRELRLGRDGELSLERIEVSYSASGLGAGRLDSLRASGLRLRVSVDETGLSFGSLDAALGSGAERAAASRGVPSRGLPALPFEEAILEDVRITARTPAGAIEIAAELAYRDGTGHLRAEVEPFTVSAAEAAALPVPGLALEAHLAPAGSELRFDLRAGDAAGRVTLHVDGSHDLSLGSGRASLRLDPVRFEAGGLQPADLLPAVAAWIRSASGTIEARGSATWQGERIGGTLDLALRDWNLESPIARLERVNAAIRLDGPWPPSAPPGQMLSMGRIDFGLELTNGLVRFGLRPDATLDLEHAEWDFAGGRIHTSGSLDLAADEQSLTLEIADVDLAQLLALVPVDGLSGEGRLGGRLPILRRGELLEIRDGLLSADTGGGWIRYRPPAKVAGLASGRYGFDVLLSALENLRYESLALTLNGETRGVVQIGLHLRGANPDYQGGRVVEFNVNLESELVDLLRQGAASYRVPEVIEQRLAEITAGAE